MQASEGDNFYPYINPEVKLPYQELACGRHGCCVLGRFKQVACFDTSSSSARFHGMRLEGPYNLLAAGLSFTCGVDEKSLGCWTMSAETYESVHLPLELPFPYVKDEAGADGVKVSGV